MVQGKMQQMQISPSQQTRNMNVPGRMRNQSASATSMTCPPGQTSSEVNSVAAAQNESKSAMRAALAAEKLRLCGKCSKCKTVIPPDMGPSTLTFPSHSASNLRKSGTTSRSHHYLGRQDAKNFRAIQFNPREQK
jgi:hypothetical protein